MRNAPKMYFSRLLIIFDITFIGVNILYHYKCLSSDTWQKNKNLLNSYWLYSQALKDKIVFRNVFHKVGGDSY